MNKIKESVKEYIYAVYIQHKKENLEHSLVRDCSLYHGQWLPVLFLHWGRIKRNYFLNTFNYGKFQK